MTSGKRAKNTMLFPLTAIVTIYGSGLIQWTDTGL